MIGSLRFNGYLFVFLGTVFVLMAIQSTNRTGGMDALTIILIAFAAFDFVLAFKFLGASARERRENGSK
ncbi:DUF4305 domain-containing protein [Alkalicoccus luteus]|uniref:DUF4305 domain-containing protein n=1 Tax=Alkalicoccus luteus TaxID=1237094 RepID=UPI004034D0FC